MSDATAAHAYRAIVEHVTKNTEASETKMMGMPALKHAGKLFGGFHDDALLLKLGKEHAQQLIASGRGRSFDPSGRNRPMKDWVALPLPSDDWQKLATKASALTPAGDSPHG